MLFYPSKTNNRLNARPFIPEAIDRRAMLNPRYPVRSLLPGTQAVCDSGAFQDVAKRRLPVWKALDAQLQYEERLRWYTPGFEAFEAVVIYDQMAGVDEAVVNGKKVKIRGDEQTAERAVAETIAAARYYASQRERIAGAIAFAGQGINPDQYLDCVQAMIPLMTPRDWFAFGGFCITGQLRSLLPVFVETVERVCVALQSTGVRRLHLLGVCWPDAVQAATKLATHHGYTISTDSRAPETAGCIYGDTYNVQTGRQQTTYRKDEKWIAYHPNELAHRNIETYTRWCQSLITQGDQP